ncbi:hypothetical protein KKE75_04615 [Patescibacteria group bacterium]|nr:hypothetical protein [Patescibacteria group bacterium]
MKLTNSYATKSDVKKLKQYIDKRFTSVDKRFTGMDKRFLSVDKRFEQIDKRFEQIDKRFEQIDKRFEWFRKEIREDLDFRFKDAFRQFEHRWQQIIDPILKEIENHREKEVIMYHQYDRMQNLLFKIAKKVGVDTEE